MPSLKECAAAGSQSKKRAAFTTSPWILAWEPDIKRSGVPGLRSIRYQIYRDNDIRRG